MTKNGLVVDSEGWFVLNARESRWKSEGPLGRYCNFEGKRRFPQLGINISVLEPGQAIGKYHRENGQEGFLRFVAGECLLIVEEQKRTLTTSGTTSTVRAAPTRASSGPARDRRSSWPSGRAAAGSEEASCIRFPTRSTTRRRASSGRQPTPAEAYAEDARGAAAVAVRAVRPPRWRPGDD